MRPYLLTWLAFLGGLIWLGTRQVDQSEAYYRPAFRLAANHRIAAEDLRFPKEWPFRGGWFLPDRSALAGKYLTMDADCDAYLKEQFLRSTPVVGAGAAEVLVTAPVGGGPPVASLLDPGVEVELEPPPPAPPANGDKGEKKQGNTEPTPSRLKIQAVFCVANADKTETCYGTFAAPPKIEDYVKATKDIRIVPTALPIRERCP